MTATRGTCAPTSKDAARTSLRRAAAAVVAIAAVTVLLAACDVLTVTVPRPSVSSSTVRVVAVVDGDTIDVRDARGDQERVRLIGLDAPEIARDGSSSDCYAQEARDELDALLYGRDVELVADPSQADRDAYGRLLRHVLVDGRSAALTAIADGAAYEYTYASPYEHQAEHVAAQEEAQRERRGLWGAC